MQSSINNKILIGFKHCGKTTVGKLLAEELTYDFIDTDNLIENNYYNINKIYLNIKEIYYKYGENYLREFETQSILNLNLNTNSIIATGGGAVLKEENVKHLKTFGQFIYLETPYEILEARASSYLGKKFNDIYEQRKNIYPKIADLIINTKNKSPEMIQKEILNG